MLSRQLVAIGKWKEAQEILHGFKFIEPKNIAQVELINIQTYQAQYEEKGRDDPARLTILKKARTSLKEIDVTLYDSNNLQILAKIALSLNLPDYASRIYKRLAEIDLKNTSKWWAAAGKWARASQQPELASHYYLKAYYSSTTEAERTKNARLSVTSNIEASQHKLAIKNLEVFLIEFPNNKYFLQTITSVNRMLGDINKEAYWNKKLWTHYGQKDEKITSRQLELELALNHLQHARNFALRLVSIKPNNKEYRQHLAQLEEWTGHPIAAQKQWSILAKTSNTSHEDEQQLRLAIMNFDEQGIIASLEGISRKRTLTADEMLERIYSYERQGRPVLSQIALDDYLVQHPSDKEKWFILAGLYENQNDYEGSIKIWKRIEKQFGNETQSAIRQVELHWNYQHHEKAYEKSATIDLDFKNIESIFHLEILSELGWRFRDNNLLIKSNEEILKRDNKNELAYERLLILADKNKDVDQAVLLAEAAWKNTEKAIYLRMAMETAIDKNDRKSIEYLLGLAIQNNNNIDNLVDYVLIMAELEDKSENFLTASKYYEYAMQLSPNNKSIHTGLLWSLLNSNQRLKLKRYLNIFQNQANRFSQYWSVYAAATHEIGESRKSVYWHSKLMHQYPDDNLWLLSYADALDADSRFNSALKIRSYVMKKIQANSIFTLLSGKSAKELTKQYIALERNRGLGANAGNMIKTIIYNTQSNTNKIPYEFLVSWYLSLKHNDMARYWHLRRQLARIKAPDNQLLNLALDSNDLKTIESLVTTNSDISPVDRNEGLRRLGLYEQALANSIEGIGVLSTREEKLLYREQAASLFNILPNYWATDSDRHSNGDLVTSKIELQTKANIHNWVFGLSVSKTNLNIDAFTVDLNGNNIETEIDLKAMRPGRRMSIYSDISINRRDDIDIMPIKLGMDYKLSRNVQFEFAWENNQLSEESTALRTLGMQDKLHIAMNANLGSREYINTHLFKTNYESRWGDDLAHGLSIDFNLGHRLSTGRNELTVQLDANWISNTLNNSLPFEVSQRLPIGSTTDLLVAEKFSTLGISMRLNRGNIKSSYPQTGSLRYFMDGWIGQSYPARKFASRFSAGFGSRILGNDELSIGLFTDQTKNLVDDQNSWGINLSYKNYIGR